MLMAFAVSTAKVDITPEIATNPFMGGYGSQGIGQRQATGANSPLHARCIVLWDDGCPNVIVAADVLGFPRSMHQAIRSRVGALPAVMGTWSAPFPDFVLSATHTHNGPALIDVLEPFISYDLANTTQLTTYSNWLVGAIVNLVATALAAPRTSVTLDYRVAMANFAYNREGLAYVETAVPVLVARGASGSAAAVVFGYGCHAVSAGIQELWDGDFPAVACAVVESAVPGSFALFLQGPAADQDPAGIRDWPLRTQLGTTLGNSVVSSVTNAGRTLTGPIGSRYQEIQIPLDVTDTPSNLALVRADYQARASADNAPTWVIRHAQRMAQQIDTHTFAKTVPLPLQVWTFAGTPALELALTGGELVSGYAVYFRNRHGGANGIWMCGYANEIPSYIPSNELLPPLHAGGSYDGGWDPDYPGIAGGSQTVYGWIGHYLAGAGGVEDAVINGVKAML
jgi:hypothetical protein